MVIDTSALAAILFNEPEGPVFAAAIASDPMRLLSAITFLETAIVVETRRGPGGSRELDLLLHHANIDVVPFDREHAEVARRGYRQFGKGRHPAGLNFGDCCSYALALLSGEPLLFKGTDFGKTDAALVAV